MNIALANSSPSGTSDNGPSSFRAFLILCVAMAGLTLSSSLRAALFEDSMSMDTNPIEFEMAGARYRIPRNYIYSMDNWAGGPQKNVSLRMLVPDLKPFSPETEACMLGKVKPRCRIYDIEMVNDFTTSEIGFENSKHMFIDQRPKQGMYGFDLYEIGPENARSERYKKMIDGRAVVFKCLVDKDSHNKIHRICDHVSKTNSGAYFYYHFPGNPGLEDAVEVDDRIRNLIDSFSAKD